MLTTSLIKRMNNEQRSTLLNGAIYAFGFTGLISYFNYREYIKKEFYRSEAHHRFGLKATNCTPWKQMFFTWWRMPEEEWTVYHRFKPYFVIGQLDFSKEILIPRERVINGQKVPGYEVVNPLYCYEGGYTSMKSVTEMKDLVKIDRAAIIVNRGWIPAQFKDKRARPNEKNQRQLVKVQGTWRKGKDIHDYKVPNNPDNNEWNNMALEDIGIFWDLVNWDEAKFYYFQAIQSQNQDENLVNGPVQPLSHDEIITEHYKWKWDDKTNLNLYRLFGGVSAASLAIAFMAA